jgi:hypothetical protein
MNTLHLFRSRTDIDTKVVEDRTQYDAVAIGALDAQARRRLRERTPDASAQTLLVCLGAKVRVAHHI